MSLSSGRDWVAFFGDAGIPSAAAKTYAASFVENRIRGDMLADLDKEYLRDMGITVLGDIICILKHAKKVVDTRKKEISLKDNTTGAGSGTAPGKSAESGESISGTDVARYKGKERGRDDKRGVAKVCTYGILRTISPFSLDLYKGESQVCDWVGLTLIWDIPPILPTCSDTPAKCQFPFSPGKGN